MKESPSALETISKMVSERLSCGLIPDNDTISFIKNCYGLSDTDEIASFIEAGDDIWALIEMLSYPDDIFRESAEEFIPYKGFSTYEIKIIEETYLTAPIKIFILFNNRKIFLNDNDSLTCFKRFVQRLNLNLNLTPFGDINDSADKTDICILKTCLRKIKFNSIDENFLFLSDLILNYRSVKNSSADELKILVKASADLMNNSAVRAMDILAEKKYFYENAVSEAEEFDRLLKTYSMEFIMLKRIQPPLIPADEARSMIRIIDRLTSIVYGMIIPSAQNIILES